MKPLPLTRKTWLVVVCASATSVLAIGVLSYEHVRKSPGPVAAPEPSNQPQATSQQPKITWSQNQIDLILSPGEGASRNLTFTSSLDLQNVVIEAVPRIAGFMTIRPNRYATVPANQALSVELIFSIPLAASLGIYDGTVHVQSGSQTFPRQNYALLSALHRKGNHNAYR
jgi:hypothetical protein